VVEASLVPPKSLARNVQPVVQDALRMDSKLLDDNELVDVTFAVDRQRFLARRCVLAAQSPYICGLFKSGRGLSEGKGRAAGQDIVIKDVSAGAFRVQLQFLYSHMLPEEEDCRDRLTVGEMARVAVRFQASELYAHCVQLFREGLAVGNVVVRLVRAHDSRLTALEEAEIERFKANTLAFQVSCNDTIHFFRYLLPPEHVCTDFSWVFCRSRAWLR